VSGTLVPPLDESDHVRGSWDAPLELVMFGDFQCPYCRASLAVLRRVFERVERPLRFAFRHLPVVERHPLAGIAAEASESAAAQGRFWEFHDALYDAQPRLTDAAVVFEIARDTGLDVARVVREVDQGRWRERIERDVRSAEESGARGTPTFFVNGRIHDDAYDAGSLVAALESGSG
jgi:protein-disulfide isomerase